jgi:hypothetical protein
VTQQSAVLLHGQDEGQRQLAWARSANIVLPVAVPV